MILLKSKYTIFTVRMILICSLHFACKKECPRKDDTWTNISNQEKSVIFYTGNEKLKYLHNKQDTLILEGLGKSTFYNKESIPNGDCPVDEHYKEAISIQYIDPLDSKKLYFDQYIGNSVISHISISFKGHKFGCSFLTILHAFDTITVLNKKFENVSLPQSESYFGDTLYYDRYSGIIKVVTEQDTWELIEK